MKIIKYRTARQCLAAFNGCRPSEIPLPGKWKFCNEKGKLISISSKKCYGMILKFGCWGWCENRSILHLWISRRARFVDALNLIAHELGHCQKPHHNSRSKEEIKAANYGSIAESALEILCKEWGIKVCHAV